MFVDELRRAAEGSPRADLHKVAGLLWKAYAAGTVTEAQASELSDLIEARKAGLSQSFFRRSLRSAEPSPEQPEAEIKPVKCPSIQPQLGLCCRLT